VVDLGAVKERKRVRCRPSGTLLAPSQTSRIAANYSRSRPPGPASCPASRAWLLYAAGRRSSGNQCVFRAGRNSPPAVGRPLWPASPRALASGGPFGYTVRGQQIWCETRADGHSPDERRCRRLSRSSPSAGRPRPHLRNEASAHRRGVGFLPSRLFAMP
jgi:hypothetical protein